jgi:hypothetical protein
MQVVALYGWQDVSTELVQALAAAVGITAYEMRQRLLGDGPAVVASFADPLLAGTLARKLGHCGVATVVLDADAVRTPACRFVVRRFVLQEGSLAVEDGEGRSMEIAYGRIDLLLPGVRLREQSETITVTERKFSLGKTLLAGGIPLTKKVERQEEVSREERESMLYLFAPDQPALLFSQGGLTYEGFGADMRLTRELNFAHLKSELRRLCPTARYDDRLQNRLGQVRILGPGLSPETHLDLAFHVLARTLRGKVLTD